MNGAEVLLEALVAAGVDTLFGLPGGHNLPIYDALHAQPGIRMVSGRHEQGVGFMAGGYASATGNVGVVVTTAGPGITNIATPLAQATAESIPILVLAINNYAIAINRHWGLFHELSDVKSFVQGTDATHQRVTKASEFSELVGRFFAAARAHRAKPLVLDIPSDVLNQDALADLPSINDWGFALEPEPAMIERCAGRLISAERPVIYVGGGAVNSCAGPDILAMAETLNAPLITTVQARGIIPDDHPLSLGCIWDRIHSLDTLARDADLVLAVGTSLSSLSTRAGNLPLGGKLIHIDIDTNVIGRMYRPQLAIVADAKAAIRRLHAAIGGSARPTEVWTRMAQLRARAWHDSLARLLPSIDKILRQLRRSLERNAIVVCDLTAVGYWAMRCLPVYAPRSLMASYYFGALGFGLPAAIGAKLGRPADPVIAITGDGGFLFNSQEMVTATKYRVPVTALLFNDGRYGAVEAEQARIFGRSHNSVRIENPDFVHLAAAYGWRSTRVRDPDRIGQAIRASQSSAQPTLIEVVVDESLPHPNDVKWPEQSRHDASAT